VLRGADRAQVEKIPPGLSVAIAWARMGVPVLPCDPATKGPLVGKGGKHLATTDEAKIREWWAEHREAIAGGRTDGLVVLDFDAYAPGHSEDLAWLAAQGDLPLTRTFSTPGKDGVRGRHLVYLDPEGRCRSGKLGRPGHKKTIDTRAGTSADYIILPGSVSAAGRYEITRWCAPAVVPDWCAQLTGGSSVNAEDQPDDSLPDYEGLPPGLDVAQLADTGVDGGNEHTCRLIRNGLEAGLRPGQLRTLAEDDPITMARCAEPKRQQPNWWPDEFSRCVRWAHEHPRKRNHPGGHPATPTSSTRKSTMNDDNEDDEKPGKPNIAQKLLAIARRDYEFGLMSGGLPYAVRKGGLNVPNVAKVFRGSTGLRADLGRAYEQEYGRPPSNNALAETLNTLEGDARHATPGKAPRLPMRVAWHHGQLVLDLGGPDGRTAMIGPDGWEVVERSPVLFLRTELTGALPEPERGGKLRDVLFPLLNLDKSDRALLVANLVSWLWPDILHPVPYLHGEEGTGKTTVTRMLRNLIDPSEAETRRLPGRDEDWETTIAGQWIIALNNLSSLPDWLSDAIATAADGSASDVKRQLFKDRELSVISIRRIIIMNSIDANLISRGDLVDRALHFELLPLELTMTEREIEDRFTDAWPLALGALLDLASKVLKLAPDVPPSDYNMRMSDFAMIAAALDRATGSGALRALRAKRADAVTAALEADPFAAQIRQLAGKGWEGTVGELFTRYVQPHLRTGTADAWPKSAAVTGTRLRRLAGMLRKGGVSVTFPRARSGNRVRIEKVPEATAGSGSDSL